MWSEVRGEKIRYIERFVDPLSGKTKKVSVTLIGKDTAQKRNLAAKELSKLIEKKTQPAAATDLTLAELADRYLAFQSRSVKPSTLKRNSFSIKTSVKLLGADSLVNNLSAGYIRDRFLQYTNNPTTLNEQIKRFKAMLRWAYDSDYLESPAVFEKLKKFKDDRAEKDAMRTEDKYLEPEQLEAVLSYMEKSHEEWYLLTKFLVLSGLRIGEAIALEKSDVKEKIHVSKTYDPNNRMINTPKTPASNRDVFVQPELADVIKEIKKFYRNRDIISGARSTHFFSYKDGSFLRYDAFRKYVKETCEKTIGCARTPHCFRHTHASLLFAEGLSIDTISRRLGHEDSKITKAIYTHIIEKVKKRDEEQLSSVRLFS